ncbi:MAG: hypothetical protein JW894_15080 [Bacteroidales bacterium]|nr:hypothetical protein [Bacteroidales bacterium]
MKHLVTILLFTLWSLIVAGQPGNDAHRRVREEKIAFFNKKLELTKSERETFWPVYNDYQNRKNKINSEKRALMQYYLQNANYMSDKEISETLNKYIDFEVQETELLTAYNEKFKEILPDSKVVKIYVAEVQFKDYLLKKLRKP